MGCFEKGGGSNDLQEEYAVPLRIPKDRETLFLRQNVEIDQTVGCQFFCQQLLSTPELYVALFTKAICICSFHRNNI